MTGIVFRRLRSSWERAAATSLLAGSGVPSASAADRDAGDTVLFGLWDLAAPPGEGLVGAAATRPLDQAGSVELCGIAVRAGRGRGGLGRRLVAEVADALRTEGAARLAVRSATANAQGPAAALLARAGFVATDADGQAAGTDAGWRYLVL